jgi:hypothetical protein
MTVLLVQTRGKLNKKHCHMLIPSSLQRRQIFQSLIARGSLEVIAICDNRICVPPCLRSNNQSDIFFYLPPPPFPFFPGDKEIRGRVGKNRIGGSMTFILIMWSAESAVHFASLRFTQDTRTLSFEQVMWCWTVHSLQHLTNSTSYSHPRRLLISLQPRVFTSTYF